MIISDLENVIVSYLGRTSVNDLNPSLFSTPPGPNIDLGMVGLNSARRRAEQAHDFRYSETNVFLSIGPNGSPLTNAYISGTLTVTGTLSPDATGIYDLAGTLANGSPFYASESDDGSDEFFITFNNGQWTITLGNLVPATDYWAFSTSNGQNPAGVYTHEGAYTGNATVSIASANVGVKRVKYVALPIGGGQYEPIEFLTNDQFLSRVRMQTGRQSFNAIKTLPMLGATGLVNPLAYQNAQTIYISAPQNLTLPITAQLNIVQWLPDYTSGTDSDFITTYGADYMYFRGIYETNNLWKRFTERVEGNIDEEKVLALADDALQRLIAWDMSIDNGTSAEQPPPFVPSAAPVAA